MRAFVANAIPGLIPRRSSWSPAVRRGPANRCLARRGDAPHSSDGGVEDAAAYLNLRPDQVRAAINYYTEFPDEIDDWSRQNQEAYDREIVAPIRT